MGWCVGPSSPKKIESREKLQMTVNRIIARKRKRALNALAEL
jgi:hypothetical protein